MVPDNPPTKASLLKWWSQFTHAQKSSNKFPPPSTDHHPVFAKPLKDSLRRASVQISTANANGDLYVWGYIPVVVAKCGLYLKENATEVPGTFRVNGSAKRMRDLQAAFETPPRYGKSLDWKNEHYTTHDVASVFRRYLTQMPEPVIPHDMYHDFRDVLARQPFNHDNVVVTYKNLIARMPRANQYLLLYLLDLLSVFARKSDKNLMTPANLAVIFRPGLISHPNHELSPGEHQLSQKVLEFLIDQQDSFLLDIPPPPRSGPSSSWRPPPRPHPHPLHDRDDPDLVLPSSDDEHPSVDGWKLVGKDNRRVTRRRTTHEPLDSFDRLEPPQGSAQLSPVAERPVSNLGSPTSASLNRSRTLPSQRSSTDDDGNRSKLLRKQRPHTPLPERLSPGANMST
ncbi:Rho GTPase activation protein [Butyriboletus roseoflavus]|nr:Rho GTPase activation protein [Butyriboletus roseoflavus]